MAQKDWKFHDYNMLINTGVKVGSEYITADEAYFLTNLPNGSYCIVYRVGETWVRKTRNEGRNGSVRYQRDGGLQACLDAGLKWARRKDEERAADALVARLRAAHGTP